MKKEIMEKWSFLALPSLAPFETVKSMSLRNNIIKSLVLCINSVLNLTALIERL